MLILDCERNTASSVRHRGRFTNGYGRSATSRGAQVNPYSAPTRPRGARRSQRTVPRHPKPKQFDWIAGSLTGHRSTPTMPPKKKPAPAWLKDKDLLNPKHGRDKLIDRLRVRPNPAKAPASLPLIHSLTPAHSSCRAQFSWRRASSLRSRPRWRPSSSPSSTLTRRPRRSISSPSL